jgi:hypothetical protein
LIEEDLFYFLQCPHCYTIFLVEESISLGHHYGWDNPSFSCKCPKGCEEPITQVSTGRLKLRVERTIKDGEPNPSIAEAAKKLKIKGIDY